MPKNVIYMTKTIRLMEVIGHSLTAETYRTPDKIFMRAEFCVGFNAPSLHSDADGC